MIKSISLPTLVHRIGVDLGTTRTRIWHDQLGMLVDEPTCVAVDTRVDKVIAVGSDAAQMWGRSPEHVIVHWPVYRGFTQDTTVVQALLTVLLQKVIRGNIFFRPTIMASIPSHADRVDQQALEETLTAVGAGEVYTIAQPLAAAIGAEVPIADASGSFILHLGGGIAEAAAISFGSVVQATHSFQVGQQIDTQLQRFFHEQYRLAVGGQEVERLKKHLISVQDPEGERLVAGQDIVEKTPKEVLVTSESLSQVFEPFIDDFTILVTQLLERVPTELTGDIIDKGMLLTGGMAQLRGLAQRLVKKLGVSVAAVEEPDQVVIKGISVALKNLELFKESLGYR